MPHRERPPLTRAVVLRGIGFGAAVVLGAVGVWLIVTSNSQKRLEIGVLAGLWGLLLGAYSMFGSRRASQHHHASDTTAGGELATRPSGLLERAEEAAGRRAYEDRLEQMLRQELNSTMTRQISSLRAEIAQLRHDLLEKVGGQLRLERIETTRLIGSDLEALQHEVRQLKVANESGALPSLPAGQRSEQTRFTEVRQVIESTRESASSRRSEDDVVDAEVVESDVVESDVVESDVVESDVVESDVVESDVVEAAEDVAAERPADDSDTPVAEPVADAAVAPTIVDEAPVAATPPSAEPSRAAQPFRVSASSAARHETSTDEAAPLHTTPLRGSDPPAVPPHAADPARAATAGPPPPARETVRPGSPTWRIAPPPATPPATATGQRAPAPAGPPPTTSSPVEPAAPPPTTSPPVEPAGSNGRQRPATPIPQSTDTPAAGDSSHAAPAQRAGEPLREDSAAQPAASPWADDPFASLPRIRPFTDFELDPVEGSANGTPSEPSYTGRRRRGEDTDEAHDSGRHYRPDGESGGGHRRSADVGATSEDLLRELMSRQGRR